MRLTSKSTPATDAKINRNVRFQRCGRSTSAQSRSSLDLQLEKVIVHIGKINFIVGLEKTSF